MEQIPTRSKTTDEVQADSIFSSLQFNSTRTKVERRLLKSRFASLPRLSKDSGKWSAFKAMVLGTCSCGEPASGLPYARGSPAGSRNNYSPNAVALKYMAISVPEDCSFVQKRWQLHQKVCAGPSGRRRRLAIPDAGADAPDVDPERYAFTPGGRGSLPFWPRVRTIGTCAVACVFFCRCSWFSPLPGSWPMDRHSISPDPR